MDGVSLGDRSAQKQASRGVDKTRRSEHGD